MTKLLYLVTITTKGGAADSWAKNKTLNSVNWEKIIRKMLLCLLKMIDEFKEMEGRA